MKYALTYAQLFVEFSPIKYYTLFPCIYIVHIYLSFICEYFTDKSFKLHGICQAHGGEMLENWWVALIKRAWLVVNSDCQCWQALRGGGGGTEGYLAYTCASLQWQVTARNAARCATLEGRRRQHITVSLTRNCAANERWKIFCQKPNVICDITFSPFLRFPPFFPFLYFFRSLFFIVCHLWSAIKGANNALLRCFGYPGNWIWIKWHRMRKCGY